MKEMIEDMTCCNCALFSLSLSIWLASSVSASDSFAFFGATILITLAKQFLNEMVVGFEFIQAWFPIPVIDLDGPHPFAQPLTCRAHLEKKRLSNFFIFAMAQLIEENIKISSKCQHWAKCVQIWSTCCQKFPI